MSEELTEEELEKLEPKNVIMVAKDGIPCIVVPPVFPPPRLIQIDIVEFDAPKRHKDFTKLQTQKDLFFLKEVLKDLDEMFKGWL